MILPFRENPVTLNGDDIDKLVEAYEKIHTSLSLAFLATYNLEKSIVGLVPIMRVHLRIVKEMEKVSYDYRRTMSKLLSRFLVEPPTTQPSLEDTPMEDPLTITDPSKLNHKELKQTTILKCWTKYISFIAVICFLH